MSSAGILFVLFMDYSLNAATSHFAVLWHLRWLLVIMFIVDIILIRTLFEDSSLADDAGSAHSPRSVLLEEEEGNGVVKSYGAVAKEADEIAENMEAGAKSESSDGIAPPSVTLVLSLIFIQFTVMCAWSVLETITSPLAADSFGWSVQQCNILFTCGGAASLVAYVSFVVGT